MKTNILKCEQTYIIPVRLEDAEPMLRALKPEATQNLSFFEKPPTLERQQEFLRKMIDSPDDRLFCIMNNGFLIGTIGLHEIDWENGNGRLGELIFDPEFRGYGHGAMALQLIINLAFGEFGLRKIYVNLLTENLYRHAYFQRLGFKRECLLEKEYLLRGEYMDMLRFRLFPEDWKNIFETEDEPA